MRTIVGFFCFLLAVPVACSSAPPAGSGGSNSCSAGACGGTTSSGVSSQGGAGGSNTTSSTGGMTATGGAGGAGDTPAMLDAVLAALRSDRDATLQSVSSDSGWPLLTEQGWLFVSTEANLTELAGDHDQWTPEAMHADQGFAWIVEPSIPEGDHYKFTDGQTYASDPWSRSVNYDNFGEISIARAVGERLDRWFGIGDANLEPRTVRVWVPAGAITHELYLHDGQNLFDPNAPWGGWHLQDSAPDGMLLVGIDNTPARMDEYTHVPDVIDSSNTFVGGKGDDYAAFLQSTVRPLVQKQYGEPGPVGVMGSSLGGLISLEIAYKYPNDYVFAASLSGTTGWGSIGPGVHNQTMIERYTGVHQKPFLYLDSGGDDGGTPCTDSDNDGIQDDDSNASDNFCENMQMEQVLTSDGYKLAPSTSALSGADLFYWHEPGAEHNEAAWAARVFRPLQIFAAL